MRTRKGADALFPRTRQQILSALLMRPDRSWFMSDLSRHLRTPKTSLQRELANLEGAGIILRDVQGRQVYYRANPACPFLPELQGLLTKTAGLVDVIRGCLRKFEKRIAVAFVFGSVASGEAIAESDVDLMVVGELGLTDLALPVRRMQEALSREVNPTVFSKEDLVARASEPGFVRRVLDKPKLFVVGTSHDLERTLEAAPGRARGTDSSRNRSAEGTR